MRVATFVGGWSCEREVSLLSSHAIEEALKSLGHDVCVIDVERNLPKLISELENFSPDVVFNALYGKGGEDGVIQGVLDILQIPYTHSSAVTSAIAMDKVLSRKIFCHNKIPTPKWTSISRSEYEISGSPIPYPYVVKPVDEGSSQGVSIVFEDSSDKESRQFSWSYGTKVLIEEFINGREISVAVLNNKVLGTVEICPHAGFYDYKTKYTDGLATHIVQAPLSAAETERVSAYTLTAHKSLRCRGVTRADFLFSNETFYLLEINTQPGLTPLSLVPEIAKSVGISFEGVIAALIESAKCGR